MTDPDPMGENLERTLAGSVGALDAVTYPSKAWELNVVLVRVQICCRVSVAHAVCHWKYGTAQRWHGWVHLR